MARSDSTEQIDAIVPREAAKSGRHHDWVATLTSACLHLVFLLILALWVLPTITRGGKQLLQVSVGDIPSYSFDSIKLATDAPPPAGEPEDNPVELPVALDIAEMELSFVV